VSDAYVHSVALMGTVVTIQVVGHGANSQEQREREDAVARAVGWFRDINDRCTRFDRASEVSQLAARTGEPVPVSPMLFEALRFALAVAEDTGGAFDPTVGQRMEARGFNREYRSGAPVSTTVDATRSVSYRDVHLDEAGATVTLDAALMLDLGAVAKGLAIDMAARELAPFRDYAIDAGGDLYLAGCNAEGQPWSVGLRHPRDDNKLLGTLRVSGEAVCTSGDYERASESRPGVHHILDARTGETANAAASVTVRAPTAMVADALATAAFVLGPVDGLALLARHGVAGLIVTPALERFATAGWVCERHDD
jgi:thiamine biosynthesis lipoprotein